MVQSSSDSQTTQTANRRTLVGVVVSDSNDKTVVVSVERRSPHRLYRKVVTRTKKYHVHDAENSATSGDIVRIIESQPRSKLKRWDLDEILIGRDIAEVQATELDASFVDEMQRSAARASAESLEDETENNEDVDGQVATGESETEAEEPEGVPPLNTESEGPEEEGEQT